MSFIHTIISGIIPSILASLAFALIKNRLKLWNPTENDIVKILNTFDENTAYKKTELLIRLIMIFLIWLFLGNFFWVAAEFIGSINTIFFRGDYSKIFNLITVFFSFLSFLSFYMGINLIIKVQKVRNVISIVLKKGKA